jgi:hypothetical protein
VCCCVLRNSNKLLEDKSAVLIHSFVMKFLELQCVYLNVGTTFDMENVGLHKFILHGITL